MLNIFGVGGFKDEQNFQRNQEKNHALLKFNFLEVAAMGQKQFYE